MNIQILNIINMIRIRFCNLLICLSVLVANQVSSATAQMPQRGGTLQVAILGWTDDTHYQIRNFDSDKKPVIQTVDIKTGKGVVIPSVKSDRELIEQALPAGTKLSISDVISPDKKSVLIVKDNDLFFFTIGDKELRKLTSDKAPEVNIRFSPDGKKIAYTKNKDLYVYDLSYNKRPGLLLMPPTKFIMAIVPGSIWKKYLREQAIMQHSGGHLTAIK